MSPSSRGKLMMKLADLIAANAQRLAEVEVRDNGKLLSECWDRSTTIPNGGATSAVLADKIQGAVVPIDKPNHIAFTRHEPVGVVAALTAWNSPCCSSPGNAPRPSPAGCTVVVKPSEFASGVHARIRRPHQGGRLPRRRVQRRHRLRPEAGSALVDHPASPRSPSPAPTAPARRSTRRPQGHCETRVARTGRQVPEHRLRGLRPGRRRVGRHLRHLRRHRPDLHRGLAPAWCRTRSARIQQARRRAGPLARKGDPMLADTNIGPVTTAPQYRKILDYMEIAKAEGARCILGGGAASDMRADSSSSPPSSSTYAPTCGSRGGSVRPRAVDHRPRHRGGSGAAGQRHDLRPGGRRLDQGHEPGAAHDRRLKAGTVWVNTYRAISYMSRSAA